MPYVTNYEKILNEQKIDYMIINWDRLQLETNDYEWVYRDKKRGHQRNFYDYMKYKAFVIRKLKDAAFDKVIVFGLQLAFFLGAYLLKNYKEKYVIDIRDHNKIIDLFKLEKVISGAEFAVISSQGYKLFLPAGVEYVMNHNTQLETLEERISEKTSFKTGALRISCIGALRDYEVNIAFINRLKNKQKFALLYHGEGEINEAIQAFIEKENIGNVSLTGRYAQVEEEAFYVKSDLINVLHFQDGINNHTFLPNRLYQAVKYKKPLIALEGSYLAAQIKKYQLGLVVDGIEQIEARIIDYVQGFNQAEYEEGRRSFLAVVISENHYFKMKIIRFCKGNTEYRENDREDEHFLRSKCLLEKKI